MLIGALYLYFRYLRPKGPGSEQSKRDQDREKLKRQFTLIVNEKNSREEKGPFWN
jgi:hypothetical protein